MSKKDQLEKLKEELEGNKDLPLRKGATQLVFGEGNPEAEIYFLGEAPGFFEDKAGRPFVGQAGRLLDTTLESISLKREDVYISNIVRFRPPQNRDPLPEEIAAFAPYIDREIEIIDPKVIVTLGRFSMNKFLPNVKISKIHGRVEKVIWNGKERVVIPMFHPAAALRSEEVMKMFKEDFKKAKEVLDKLSERKIEQLNLI